MKHKHSINRAGKVKRAWMRKKKRKKQAELENVSYIIVV